jgi:hypothetical protein
MLNDEGLSDLKTAVKDLVFSLHEGMEDNKMSQNKTAGTRTEFVRNWKEWGREINRLAYQSDDPATIMVAIDLRIRLLALIDDIAYQLYPSADVPADYDMAPWSPIGLEANDDQSAD